MARYFGEYEDCFISEEREPPIKRTGGDFEVSGEAAKDGYTVLNRRVRTMTAGDWPDDVEDAKRLEDALGSFPGGSMIIGF